MIVRLVPMNGPLRYLEFEMLKNGTTLVRTDSKFVEHGSWEQEGEVLELTIDDFALRIDGNPQQLVFDIYDAERSKR